MMLLGYLAIVSIQSAGNVSSAELEADLRKRLESKSFSVERISILEEELLPSRILA